MLKKIIEIIKKNLIPTMLIGALLLSAVCAATYMGGTDLILDLLQAIDTDMRNSGIN